jgi:6-pyruvoyltetrahydropterin/6-carboxytetrahydropterin synthase
MVMDFQALKRALLDVLEELDHRNLNALPAFGKVNPSAENIARFVYDRLAKKIVARGVRLVRIRVAESTGCWATYGRQG